MRKRWIPGSSFPPPTRAWVRGYWVLHYIMKLLKYITLSSSVTALHVPSFSGIYNLQIANSTKSQGKNNFVTDICGSPKDYSYRFFTTFVTFTCLLFCCRIFWRAQNLFLVTPIYLLGMCQHLASTVRAYQYES